MQRFLTLIVIVAFTTGQILDGSFEGPIPNPYWFQNSTLWGPNLICDNTCFTNNPVDPPSGTHFIWAGGSLLADESEIRQTIKVPADNPTLTFSLRITPIVSPFLGDRIEVYVDSFQVASWNFYTWGPFTSYNTTNIDLSTFVDGKDHVLRFHMVTDDKQGSPYPVVSFMIDAITMTPPLPGVVVPQLTTGQIAGSSSGGGLSSVVLVAIIAVVVVVTLIIVLVALVAFLVLRNNKRRRNEAKKQKAKVEMQSYPVDNRNRDYDTTPSANTTNRGNNQYLEPSRDEKSPYIHTSANGNALSPPLPVKGALGEDYYVKSPNNQSAPGSANPSAQPLISNYQFAPGPKQTQNNPNYIYPPQNLMGSQPATTPAPRKENDYLFAPAPQQQPQKESDYIFAPQLTPQPGKSNDYVFASSTQNRPSADFINQTGNSNQYSGSNPNSSANGMRDFMNSPQQMSNVSKKAPPMANNKSIDIDYNELEDLQEIGRGSFGIVYRANWRSIRVAVKQLNVEKLSEKAINDFRSEAEILKNLRNHPNVVLFIGITSPPQPITIVTEYCDNGSLWKLLRSNIKLESDLQFKILIGTARGMLHLHAEKIVHRDLAARNILLTENFEPKVSDFGLSRQNLDSGGQTASDTGPLKWMSPESIKLKSYSTASDVWAFGVTVWETVTRNEPYPGMDPVNVAMGVCYEGLRLQIPFETDPILADVMKSCWETEPDRRPSFKDVVNKLTSNRGLLSPPHSPTVTTGSSGSNTQVSVTNNSNSSSKPFNPTDYGSMEKVDELHRQAMLKSMDSGNQYQALPKSLDNSKH